MALCTCDGEKVIRESSIKTNASLITLKMFNINVSDLFF